MNRRVSSGSSDGRVEANKDDLAAGSSAPDDPTVHRSIASEQLCQWSCAVEATTSTPDEPTPGKSQCRIIRWYYFQQLLANS
jgi:hypothetical protein